MIRQVLLLIFASYGYCSNVLRAMRNQPMNRQVAEYFFRQKELAVGLHNSALPSAFSVLAPFDLRWSNLQALLISKSLARAYGDHLDFIVADSVTEEDERRALQCARVEQRMRLFLQRLPAIAPGIERSLQSLNSSPSITYQYFRAWLESQRQQDFLAGRVVAGLGLTTIKKIYEKPGIPLVIYKAGADGSGYSDVRELRVSRTLSCGFVFSCIDLFYSFGNQQRTFMWLIAPGVNGGPEREFLVQFFDPRLPIGLIFLLFHNPKNGCLRIQIG